MQEKERANTTKQNLICEIEVGQVHGMYRRIGGGGDDRVRVKADGVDQGGFGLD